MVQIVTGSAGFIGSHLVEELVQDGRRVIGIDNFQNYYSEDVKRQNLKDIRGTTRESEGEFKFIEGSILEKEDLEKLPSEPENVFHHAAIAGVRNSIENPSEYIETNVLATSKLLEYFNDIGKFIFASSSSVYGNLDASDLPAQEHYELDPIAPYPLSKVQSEQIVQLYSELYGIDHVILRYFTVYGPRQRPDEAFTKFIKMILNGEPVTIYGDGNQSRDFTFVKDIVKANLLAAEKARNEKFNIGSGRRVTVNEMVDTLGKVMDEDVEKKYVEQPEGDARHTHAHVERATKRLGFEAETEFDEGTKSCVEWVRRMHNKGIF